MFKNFNFTALQHCINRVFAFIGAKAIVIKAIRLIFGLRLNDLTDAETIIDLKRLESICVSFNILPNGFAQDRSVTPSKWTKTKSILYTSLMTVNIVHLILLSFFELPQDLSLILGDFFYGHPRRRYFWLFWTGLSIFGEALRHKWIYLYKTGGPFPFNMYNSVFDKGFKPEALSMSQVYCHKYRFISSSFINLWIRYMKVYDIGMGPVLIIIVQSVSQLPKTPQQFLYTYFWLLISYLGIVCTLLNLQLTGAVTIIDLSYFYFRAAHVTQTLQNFVTEKMYLQKSYFKPYHETAIHEIILFLNEIEYRNHKERNWFIFLYLGVSFIADFGFYAAAIVHIDHGLLDGFLIFFTVACLLAIGTCSYFNGLILTLMHTCDKKIMLVTKYLPSDLEAFIKFNDLQSRLSRTDIAFTIGEILDLTTRVFVIYVIENATLIMMLVINVK